MKTFYCPVTLDQEDFVDCLCGLMVPKESCIVNEKVVITVKGHPSLKLKLVTTSKVLQTCYGKHENIKQFGKAILTTLVFNKTRFYFVFGNTVQQTFTC